MMGNSAYFEWLPSQNGLFLLNPQPQSLICPGILDAGGTTGSPALFRISTGPSMMMGPAGLSVRVTGMVATGSSGMQEYRW